MKKLLFLLSCLLGFGFNIFSQSKSIPQITLSNSIQFINESFKDLPGNGFLIDIGDEVLAVTCKHTLWVNRDKDMKTVDFKGKLKEWRMVVVNEPLQYVVLGDLINTDSKEAIGESNTEKDYLVFRIKENHSKITPLKLSVKPMQPSDTIFEVGWTFRTKTESQQFHTAKVYSYLGSFLLVNHMIQENLAGLSGSPVINKNNELVGIVSSWTFDIASNSWYDSPCSTDYLWEVLYSYWLKKNSKEKSINSFKEYLNHYKSLNGSAPEVSSYLYIKLFYGDWLKSKGMRYGSIESFNLWASNMLKLNGIKITTDKYCKRMLIFDTWKENYSLGKKSVKDLEQMVNDAKTSVPSLIDFCEYSQELSAEGKHDKSIELLLYADEKIQHMGQLYAYLGDAYLAKGDKQLAKDAYLKCLKTYPEHPQALEGIEKLK